MAQTTPEKSAWQTLTWQQQTRVLLFWLVAIAVVMGVSSSFQDGQFNWQNLGGNLATELMGGVLTFFVFQFVLDKRDEDSLKARLIREMGSSDNATALRAVEELRAHGWLYDGSLIGADLDSANLENVNLEKVNLLSSWLAYANLQDAKLMNANLQKADMRGANLQNANLINANLQNANLWGANLQMAGLTDANLNKANLEHSNLQEARLGDANLQNVNLRETVFDEKTELPDSKLVEDEEGSFFIENGDLIVDKHWTPETDMTRYTDPNHPDFWQPDWVKNQQEGKEG